MYQGIIIPFKKNYNSNLIVRVLYKEVKIFKTRERCPFLIFLETVDKNEIEQQEIKWEKDFDYLRWNYNIMDKNNNDLEKVKVDMTATKLREAKNM